MAMALSSYEHHHQPKNESSTTTRVKDEPVSRAGTPHHHHHNHHTAAASTSSLEPRFPPHNHHQQHNAAHHRPHRRIDTPPYTASSSQHNVSLLVKDVSSRPSSVSGRSLSGPISLLADVALGHHDTPTSTSSGLSRGARPTLPSLASIPHLDRRPTQPPPLQPIYTQQTVRDGEAGSAQRGVVATAQGTHSHYVNQIGYRPRRLSLDGQGRDDRSSARHTGVTVEYPEHRILPSATRLAPQPRPVATVSQAWHQADNSAWREFPHLPPGVAAPLPTAARRIPPPQVLERPASDSRQPPVSESYWASLGPSVPPRQPYQMPRLSSSRGSGSSKSKPQQWTFVTEDPGKPKHFNHAGRTSEEDAVPRAGESPGTNVVARGAPSPSSGALPRQWAPIGNSASAFSSGERGNVASSLRPSNPPHHPSRQQARPHSQPERPESAGEAYAPSSAASDSGEEHADDTANGHTSDSSLPPSQGTRLRSSERLRKRGRDDPPSSESPLQPLSVDGDGDDASEPELQVVKAEDDVRPKKRTYVRRDAQRRKEQNAQAQKKFRWKKKAMAEQMSKDLLDHKRKNKELEARCAELIELANDKDQQLTNKETLLGRLRNENGTLKRRLEVMNRRFGFDHDDEASGPSSS